MQQKAHNEHNTFIIFGASNVTLNLPLIHRIICKSSSKPVKLFVAAGHGRSYCSASSIGFAKLPIRSLPSISNCGIWRAIESEFSFKTTLNSSTSLLITDIGNDLLYGFSPETITDAIRNSIIRLQTIYSQQFSSNNIHGDTDKDITNKSQTLLEKTINSTQKTRIENSSLDIVLALLPIERLQKMSERQYKIARKILFPGKKEKSLEEMLHDVHTLQNALYELANSFQLKTILPDPHWYGLDPIHIKRSKREEAWKTILALWDTLTFEGLSIKTSESISSHSEQTNRLTSLNTSLLEAVKIHRLKPEQRGFLGKEQFFQQPALVSKDNNLLYLF